MLANVTCQLFWQASCFGKRLERLPIMNIKALKTDPDDNLRFARRLTNSKRALSDAWGDGRARVGRLVKRTRHRTEELIDEACHSIKRAPLRSVAVAFGVGALLGTLIVRDGKH